MRQAGARSVCWEVPYDLAAVGRARALVGEVLGSWGLRGLADDVVLVVGELLANAVAYGEPPVGLLVWAGEGELVVQVSDHGAERPRRLRLDVEAVHGRGLAIVEALADESGVAGFADESGPAWLSGVAAGAWTPAAAAWLPGGAAFARLAGAAGGAGMVGMRGKSVWARWRLGPGGAG
ncbi:ATP-binding protein [Sphaerisporangium sp. TRM90804]|uniref:ATP-binding protein n=1 Tax=Sphaerisporangium sp. TRM90804 TaxID=3031113 RepID=UPI002449E2DA|nr:ATP-binding protein [Sphaerisporangium sp. TRM90804]MDH2429154.1 ATP-binding protein [Sphaerisporangium sp. TRM90804]